MTTDKTNEKKLLKVIEDHHTALAIGGRNEEFDKLIEYLKFYRQPAWKKVAIILLKGLGVAISILVFLGLLGVRNWF